MVKSPSNRSVLPCIITMSYWGLVYIVVLCLVPLPTVTNSTISNDEAHVSVPGPTPSPSMHHMDYIRSRATLHNKKAEQYIHDLKEEMQHDHTDKNPRNKELLSRGTIDIRFYVLFTVTYLCYNAFA